ncbi:MAG: SMC family ATPase, partial [Blautia sp.]|nr:SMC family ATPase [Blautia sp.]
MRPHKLTMKAFGPFAKETTVDFNAMGNTIYLISGDTGSGKTTIFDGIIYALYGTASGGARSGLGTEAFHSDYAKSGSHRDELRVELTFSNAGRSFTVTRTMNWGKKGDSKVAAKTSVLAENGSILVHGRGREDRDEVTRKITEILGLDADQFRRIIMLAQGEFQKFLTARSDERGVILGKLYDNRRHQDFQFRLKAAANLLREEDNALVNAAQAQLKLFIFPGDTTDEERETLSLDHPSLPETMQRIIERVGASREDALKAIHEKEEEQKKLEALRTRGQTCNSLLDDLERKKQELAGLEQQTDMIQALREQVRLARAAEKVIPSELAMLQAEEDAALLLQRIGDLEEKRGLLSEQAASLKKQAEAVEKTNVPAIAELTARTAQVQGILHFYDDLAAGLADQAAKAEALKQAEERVSGLQAELEKKRQRQQELADTLKSLAQAGDMAVSAAAGRLKEYTDRKAELQDLSEGLKKVQNLIKEEAVLKKRLETAQAEELQAAEAYMNCNKAFILGQAGILAMDLRKQLETADEVICPVCGARHTASDIPGFAPWHEDIPTGEAVDQAFSVLENARRTLKTAEEAHRAKAGTLSLQRQLQLDKAQKLLGASDWEALSGSNALERAADACNRQITEAEGIWRQAVADKAAKDKAAKDKLQTDAEISAAEKELTESVRLHSEARVALTAADARVAAWKKQLVDYPDKKEDALNQIRAREEQVRELQLQIDSARKKLADCQNERAANEGSLSSARSEKEARERAKEATKKAYQTQLNKWFSDNPDAYHQALSPEGRLLDQDSLDQWISEKRSEIDGYDRHRSDLNVRIEQLKASTRDMERVDISAITAQITQVTEALNDLRARENDLSLIMKTDRRVCKELTSILDTRSRYRRAFEKLGPLADTADGKYAFSRYVLTGFFHRIVEQANIHLETMTDGEYCLVPKETGDGRSNLGLELKVLNTITNLERDTASLSGGQLFEASLSLALGLSDIVQMQSTSEIQIDSMFIDEGFGSLDGARLDKAIAVLQHLAAGKRQIGIISHVARLDECLQKKIHVVA